MLEQELASIIKFVLDSTGNPFPYYWKIPESFCVPSAYFSPPEITSGADMLSTYSLQYAWYIMMFASSDQAAYVLGQTAVEAIRRARNLIPLIDTDGNEIEGHYVRVDDPTCKLIDSGACQLQVVFTSRRYYPVAPAPKMESFETDIFVKDETYTEPAITPAMVEAVEKYLTPSESNSH